jgi:hypothetical protein
VEQGRTTSCFVARAKVVHIPSEFQTEFMHSEKSLQGFESAGNFEVKVVIHSPYH